MAAAENSRILRVGSNTLTRRFRSSLSFPPPPKPSPLGFHRAHLSLRDQKTNENYELNIIIQSHSTVAAPCHPLAAVFQRPLARARRRHCRRLLRGHIPQNQSIHARRTFVHQLRLQLLEIYCRRSQLLPAHPARRI